MIDHTNCLLKASQCRMAVKANHLTELSQIHNNTFGRASKQMANCFFQDFNEAFLTRIPNVIMVIL
jgi:hypothetical protein